MILQDPFTPHSCPKKCPWNWSKIQQYIEDKRCGSEHDLYSHESLKSHFSPKPRQYKPPASPFSVRKGAGFYLEKSESIVHQHKILPTYVIRHTLHNHFPTFPTFLAGSFQYTWDVNNYRDQIREGKQKGESRQEREREREKRAANSINSWSSPA